MMRKIFITAGVVVFSLMLVASGLITLKNKVQADQPTVSTDAWKVKLIVVTIDPKTGQGSLTGYSDGGAVVSAPVVFVGTSPEKAAANMYSPSVEGCGTDHQNTDSSCMTSLGVYTALSWTKPLAGNLSGEWFLNLEGQPVFGGDPVCGTDQTTKDGKNCRHLGIHFASSYTHGCLGVPNKGVCTTLTDAVPDNSGAKVIVTDYALRGTVSPVDLESYSQSETSLKKIDKGHFTQTTSIDGVKVDNFGSAWIAEVAAPGGNFQVTNSASGYKNDYNSINIVRDTGHRVLSVNGQSTNISTESTSILALDKTMMAMKSNYTGTFYDDGYVGYYRASNWDKTYVTVSGNTLNLCIGDSYPKPMTMMGHKQTVNAKTQFGVSIIVSPWQDLGYGSYFKEPWYTKMVGTFTIDYDNTPSNISVNLDTTGLSENEVAQMNKWGVVVYKMQPIGHTLNDYIAFNSIKTTSQKAAAATSNPTQNGGTQYSASGSNPSSGSPALSMSASPSAASTNSSSASSSGSTGSQPTSSSQPVYQPQPVTVSNQMSGNYLSPVSVSSMKTSVSPMMSSSTMPRSSQSAQSPTVAWYNPVNYLINNSPTQPFCQAIWVKYNANLGKPSPSIWQLTAYADTMVLNQQKDRCDQLYTN